jgi:uncharacterized membrane protein YfcA
MEKACAGGRPFLTSRTGMSAFEIAGLFAAAAAAGAINAVAGGGTLLTFPALLLAGTPAVVANATSTVALVIGIGGSVYGYRRQIGEVKAWLRRFLPVSLLGGLLGGILLTTTSEQAFSRMVPFLLLFASVLFLAQGPLSRWLNLGTSGEQPVRRRALWAALLFQFGVSLYGGYFGAGIGILMLATLGFLGLSDIHQMNAVKTVLGSLINLVAAAWFIGAGLVDWPKAGIMTFGAMGGYFLGAHFAQKISQRRVRQVITAVGFGISAVTFYREFLR